MTKPDAKIEKRNPPLARRAVRGGWHPSQIAKVVALHDEEGLDFLAIGERFGRTGDAAREIYRWWHKTNPQGGG